MKGFHKTHTEKYVFSGRRRSLTAKDRWNSYVLQRFEIRFIDVVESSVRVTSQIKYEPGRVTFCLREFPHFFFFFLQSLIQTPLTVVVSI